MISILNFLWSCLYQGPPTSLNLSATSWPLGHTKGSPDKMMKFMTAFFKIVIINYINLWKHTLKKSQKFYNKKKKSGSVILPS